MRVTSGPRGVRRATGFSADAAAALTTFAEGDGRRLAWQLDYRAAPLAHYHAVVDAATGAILYRANSVKTAANDASVWEQYPGAANGGTQQTRDLTPYLSPGATDLSGPYAHAWSDVNDNDSATTDSNGHIVPLDAPDPGEAVARTAGGDFAFPFTDFTSGNTCGACDTAHKCSWNFDDSRAGRPTARRTRCRPSGTSTASATTSPRRRSRSRRPTATSRAATACSSTPTTARPRSGGGPDTKHVDNAYMDTPPDGTSPDDGDVPVLHDGTRRDFRDVNGGDDAAIVYHEYTHGLSSRLVTDRRRGAGAQQRRRRAAMGEGWSDWYAKDFLVDAVPADDTAGAGRGRHGQLHRLGAAHASAPRPSTVLSAPRRPQCPGTATAGRQAATPTATSRTSDRRRPARCHADGEIWAETLWDLRGGSVRSVTEAIVTQGMRLSPPEPTFLEERDAILAADHQLFPCADHSAQIWEAFAHRGMGTNASSPTKDVVVEGFDRPPSTEPPGSPACPTAPASPRSLEPGGAGVEAPEVGFTRSGPLHLHLRLAVLGSARLTVSRRTAQASAPARAHGWLDAHQAHRCREEHRDVKLTARTREPSAAVMQRASRQRSRCRSRTASARGRPRTVKWPSDVARPRARQRPGRLATPQATAVAGSRSPSMGGLSACWERPLGTIAATTTAANERDAGDHEVAGLVALGQGDRAARSPVASTSSSVRWRSPLSPRRRWRRRPAARC